MYNQSPQPALRLGAPTVEIFKVNESGINFKTLKGLKGKIPLQKLKWAIPNKKTMMTILRCIIITSRIFGFIVL